MRARSAPIDLVFSDVILPDMSGPAMVRQIQQWHPESDVLFMSGYTDQGIVHQGVLAPDTAFLQKPFTADQLTRTVRDLLDARVARHVTGTPAAAASAPPAVAAASRRASRAETTSPQSRSPTSAHRLR